MRLPRLLRLSDGETVLGIPRMSPMLAGVARAPFDGNDWLFEIKWDGYRCLAYLTMAGMYLDSRNGKPLLPQFPALAALKPALRAREVLLDGEIVAMKAGRPDFSLLRANPKSVVYAAFDLLWVDGRSLIETPLTQRKEALMRAMDWGGAAVLSETVEGEGKALFAWARDREMEGVMAKRKGSLYRPGERTAEWLKIKNLRQGTFWVVGYVPSPGRLLGSLVVAERLGGSAGSPFRLVGRVSSGLNREYEDVLLRSLEPCGGPGPAPRPPAGLMNLPPRSELRQVRWVKPFFGVDVDYTEMTADGHLRHPVFKEVVPSDATRSG